MTELPILINLAEVRVEETRRMLSYAHAIAVEGMTPAEVIAQLLDAYAEEAPVPALPPTPESLGFSRPFLLAGPGSRYAASCTVCGALVVCLTNADARPGLLILHHRTHQAAS